MAKCDLKYRLHNKQLTSLVDALRYKDNKEKIKIFTDFIKNLDNIKEQGKKFTSENADLNSFIGAIKNTTFFKNIERMDHLSYPNLIGEFFEKLNPKSWRQDVGQFFTPQQIADQIPNHIHGILDNIKSVCDPCAGAGALVLAFKDQNNVIRYANDLEYINPYWKANAIYHGLEINEYDGEIVDLMVINPPFNQNDVLEFLELASVKAKNLVLIVPTGFSDSNRNYKKAYEYFEQNFIELDSVMLEGDAFDWMDTKIQTKLIIARNLHEIEENTVMEVVEKTDIYEGQLF